MTIKKFFFVTQFFELTLKKVKNLIIDRLDLSTDNYLGNPNQLRDLMELKWSRKPKFARLPYTLTNKWQESKCVFNSLCHLGSLSQSWRLILSNASILEARWRDAVGGQTLPGNENF